MRAEPEEGAEDEAVDDIFPEGAGGVCEGDDAVDGRYDSHFGREEMGWQIASEDQMLNVSAQVKKSES